MSKLPINLYLSFTPTVSEVKYIYLLSLLKCSIQSVCSSIKSDDVESLCEDAPHYFELESNGPSRRQRAVPPPLPVSDGTVPPPLPAPALHYQPSVTIASIPQSPHALLPAGHIPHGAVPVTVAMPMSKSTCCSIFSAFTKDHWC